jgi:ADP-ribose pyrophosphatase
MQPWKTLKRDIVLRHSKWLTVENHTIQLPDGRILDEWPWVITPAYVNVLPLTVQGRFLCFRQTKHGIEGTSLAPIGGYLDEGEEPLAAARRELQEETGYGSDDWLDLGTYTVDGNHGAGVAHLFLARRAQHTAEPVKDDLEEQELVELTPEQLEVALRTNQFKVLSWATVGALALLHMRGEPQ